MKFKVEYKGHIIAEFESKIDMEQFLEWKRESILKDMNSAILDQIASENGLDRKTPGLFPISIVEPYYKRVKEQIKQDCKAI